MSSFSPVNTSLAPESQRQSDQERTPTTPRPHTAPHTQSPHPQTRMDDSVTPTKANFGLQGQKPLPDEPFPAAVTFADSEKSSLSRGGSQHSAKSRKSEDMDMDIDGSEGDDGNDGNDGNDSEGESIAADGTRSKKGKKSQRFWCDQYPPCNLSFTRSEHLLRHIRKHTGERPFMCHCSRRFSRLDNLRQHAQTVHVNEDIPNDSLAATSSRFQRSIRTDKVRPTGTRARAGTTGSQGRGHQRNALSTSSIGSISSYTSGIDPRRRQPPPLVMAGGNPRYSGELTRPDSPNGYQYRPYSPGGFSTPTSATFSTGQNSPRWGSAIQSPISRTESLYNGHRTHQRRLSVPSAQNPFQSPHTGSYGPPPLGTNPNAPPYTPSYPSPTTPSSSAFSRRDSLTSVQNEVILKRRTWHPETTSYSSFTTRLQSANGPNYYSNGPPPQVPILPSNAPPPESIRLPGIKSFDPVPQPQAPQTPHRQPSPMMIDAPSGPRTYGAPYRDERPTSQHWDRGLPQDLNRLDIAQRGPPNDGASTWASEANRAVQAQAEQSRAQPPILQQQVRFEESPYSVRSQQSYQHQSAPPTTPREVRRHAWYNGPVTPIAQQNPPIDPRIVARTSPEDSSSSEGVPGTPHSVPVAEYHPDIIHSNGYVEKRSGVPAMAPNDPRILQSNAPSGYPLYQSVANGQESTYTHTVGQQAPSQIPQQQIPITTTKNMSALDTLVAVATSEENISSRPY
ncbi:hypothetical protein B0O99DRAFT_688336 [Bisporella sp. PMI_857]|nr:hypothetical protein B0O99DRAFT_688336 [Bisporella sp. PMI_857]